MRKYSAKPKSQGLKKHCETLTSKSRKAALMINFWLRSLTVWHDPYKVGVVGSNPAGAILSNWAWCFLLENPITCIHFKA